MRRRRRANAARRRREGQRASVAAKESGPPADWTSEEKQNYALNKEICASEPLSQLASEYHVAVNPAAAAHAVGLEYRNREDMEIAAEEGCLAALDR